MRRSRSALALLVAAIVVVLVGFVVRFSTPASVATPSASAAVTSATETPSVAPTPSPSPQSAAPSTQSPAVAVRPDARHGLVTRGGGLRTEDSAIVLANIDAITAAVSPDGKRVAYVQTSQTGQRLLTFDTARPQQQVVVLDFAGTGEFVIGWPIVWASDGSSSVLVHVSKGQPGPIDPPAEYSALRSVDLATKTVREEVRITDGGYLVPLAWRSADRLAIAATTGGGGFAGDYVVVRAGQVSRAAFPRGGVIAHSLRATHDGSRILAVFGVGGERTLRWWPAERFGDQQEIRPAAGEFVGAADWRGSSDEIGVAVRIANPTATAPLPRFEIWTTGGGKRVVSPSAEFVLFRHDGSAGITAQLQLIDLGTGALTQLPGAGPNEFAYLPVLF